MSFGFSVGDFVTARIIIKDIISCLKDSGGSASEYQELARELGSLQVSLDNIRDLKVPPLQDASLKALQYMALSCQNTLDEFRMKINKYRTLEDSKGMRNSWGKKIKWQVLMKDNVQKLRMYLGVHTASMTLQMTALGLQISNSRGDNTGMTNTISEQGLIGTRAIMEKLNSTLNITHNTFALAGKIVGLVEGVVSSQLLNLVNMGNRLLQYNAHIVQLLTQLQPLPAPDIRHTWFEEPVRLQDAVGTVIALSATFNWVVIDTIISERFKSLSGLAYEKVRAGEYEIFHSGDASQTIEPSSFTYGRNPLTPGMNITMAFIVGQYENASSQICPRPSCGSTKFTVANQDGLTCAKCEVWFDSYKKSIPRPYRDPTKIVAISDQEQSDRVASNLSLAQDLRQKRTEKLAFKCIKLHKVQLPPTPDEIAKRQRRKSSRPIGLKEANESPPQWLREVIMLSDDPIGLLNTLAAGASDGNSEKDNVKVAPRRQRNWSVVSNWEGKYGPELVDSNTRERRNTGNYTPHDIRVPYNRRMTSRLMMVLEELEDNDSEISSPRTADARTIFENELYYKYGPEYSEYYLFVEKKGYPPYFRLKSMYTYLPELPQYPEHIPFPEILEPEWIFRCVYDQCSSRPIYQKKEDLLQHYKEQHSSSLPQFRCMYGKCKGIECLFDCFPDYRQHALDFHGKKVR